MSLDVELLSLSLRQCRGALKYPSRSCAVDWLGKSSEVRYQILTCFLFSELGTHCFTRYCFQCSLIVEVVLVGSVCCCTHDESAQIVKNSAHLCGPFSRETTVPLQKKKIKLSGTNNTIRKKNCMHSAGVAAGEMLYRVVLMLLKARPSDAFCPSVPVSGCCSPCPCE